MVLATHGGVVDWGVCEAERRWVDLGSTGQVRLAQVGQAGQASVGGVCEAERRPVLLV